VPAAHAVHVFSVNAFNLGNRLYRNHLSLIKDLAPEMGRGVRFGYTVRLF
jgi:iron complex outermembrane receptor protein